MAGDVFTCCLSGPDAGPSEKSWSRAMLSRVALLAWRGRGNSSIDPSLSVPESPPHAIFDPFFTPLREIQFLKQIPYCVGPICFYCCVSSPPREVLFSDCAPVPSLELPLAHPLRRSRLSIAILALRFQILGWCSLPFHSLSLIHI